jgi:saccharopine dehydrogenase-like NADP-dependent oxidoreductase
VALRAGCHYVDLGGLFHVTRRQLRLHARFKARARLAVLGMGAAPGIVNVLARAAADDMELVHEVHIAVAGVDRTPPRDGRVLASSYSLQTVLDEASLPAAVFTGGRFHFVPPMSDPEPTAFPPPVGAQSPSRTIHSEVATLPLSFKQKGIREVSFRIAFAPDLDRQLRFLSGLGLLSRTPLKAGRNAVAPRDVVAALLKRLPAPAPPGPPDEHEVLRVLVRGRRDGAAVEDLLECHVPGIPAWGVGVDADTGCPPSIVMQMIARREIDATGVRAPETVVPAETLFRELERRGMRVEHRRGTRG